MGMAAILVMWPASCHQIFISLYLKAFIKKLVQIGKAVSEKILFEFLYVLDLGPRSRNDLDLQYSHTFIYSIRWLLQLVSEKIHSFHFFPQKSLSYQIWPCRKIGQGHSRVIIWTNYDGLESPMLHTRFRRNRPAGSGEDFWRVFTTYGPGDHLGHVTSIMSSDFHFLVPKSFHKKFGSDPQSSFWENPVWIFECTRPWNKVYLVQHGFPSTIDVYQTHDSNEILLPMGCNDAQNFRFGP